MELNLVAPDHTAIFLPMQTMTKESIRYLKNFKESSDFFDFDNKYGNTQSSNLCEALWLCARNIMRCGYKLQTTTIVLFTDNEEPYAPNSSDLQKVFIRAKDLQELGVYFMLVPMVDEFDDTKFYREFICTVTEQDPETFRFLEPAQQRTNLMNRVFQKDYRRSCLRYFNFSLSDDLEMSCGIYSFTKQPNPPKTIHLLRDTNEIVQSKRTYFIEEYDEEMEEMRCDRRLLPAELRKYQDRGGQKICFTPEELATMKSMITPGMKLLGFKPLSQLPARCFIKSTRFLYPNDSSIKGSGKLFRALWEKCIEKEKFALCVFTQIRKIAPR